MNERLREKLLSFYDHYLLLLIEIQLVLSDIKYKLYYLRLDLDANYMNRIFLVCIEQFETFYVKKPQLIYYSRTCKLEN